MNNKYIAFSGGVESTTMCLLYGKGATAIFTDTGAEHEVMYERIDYIENMLKEIHDGDFELLKIRASVKIPKQDKRVDNLLDYIFEAKFLPGRRERFCTRLFKIEAMDKFLQDKGACELMIGLNHDEAESRDGNLAKLENVRYTYPLVEDKITRYQCLEKLKMYGLEPNFPAYMSRGGCICCPFKRKKEYAAMVHLAPDEIDIVAKIEKAVQDKRGKFFRIRDNMPDMRTFIQTEKQNLFGDLTKFYVNDEDIYSCGVFCHR